MSAAWAVPLPSPWPSPTSTLRSPRLLADVSAGDRSTAKFGGIGGWKLGFSQGRRADRGGPLKPNVCLGGWYGAVFEAGVSRDGPVHQWAQVARVSPSGLAGVR